jgi:adenine C2-methylase RlmN of 23S rRNA A2503 and tRNA A37
MIVEKPISCVVIAEKSFENSYNSCNWDKEISTKYVVQFSHDLIVEVSFFSHYKNGKHIKNAIEIPLSYGCVIGCKHCASGQVSRSKLLGISQLIYLFEFIVNKHFISKDDKFNVSFTGIGESTFQLNNLLNLSNYITNKFSQSEFVFSTVGISNEYINRINELSLNLPIRYLLITYLHYDINKIIHIIPTINNFQYSFNELVNTIEKLSNIKVRFNYVVIRNYNDDYNHLSYFMDQIKKIKNKIVIRVSKLNETEISRRNGILSSDSDSLFYISEQLLLNGFNSYSFYSKQNDNMNCGQLIWNYC